MYNKSMMVPAAFRNKFPEISVLLDDSDDDIIKKFHCLVCGWVVFEYYNYVKIIVAGKHLHKSPKVIQCNNMVTMDTVTKQVAHVTTEDYNANRGRYFKIKCRTKYWIS